MILVDTHAHLYVTEFDNDREEVIERAREQGVAYIFLPNIDSKSIQSMHALADKYPENCFPMMGIHPSSIREDFETELTIAQERVGMHKYAAIGEIGLDYYWDTSFREEQLEALKMQVSWAKQADLPVVLHCRDAFDDLINCIEEYHEGALCGVFHCFTGNMEDAGRILDLNGFYMGIGGVLTYKNSDLARTLEGIPLERIVLETDSPYLTPVPYRGKRNESAYIRIIAERVAEIKKVSVEQVAEITTANAAKLFRKELK